VVRRAGDVRRAATRAAAGEAERNAAIAEAVNGFLRDDLLAAVDPTRTADRDITVREVLDRASLTVGDRFAGEPMVEAATRATLALTYERIGYPADAEPHRRRELEIYAAEVGEGDRRAVAARTSLATNAMMRSRFDDAIDLLTRNIALMDGRPEFEQDLLPAKNNLAAAYLELGRFEEAAPILADTLEAKRRELGDADPSTLTSIHNLAGLYYSLGEIEQSERHYREAYEGRAAVLGNADPKTISSAIMWGRVLTDQARFDEAESVIDGVLGTARERLDPGHPMHLNAVAARADLLGKRGDWARAESAHEETVRLRTEHQGPDHVLTIQEMGHLADVRFALGRYEEALTLVDEVRERQARVLPEGHWSRGVQTVLAGRCHDALGRPELAEPLLAEGLCGLLAALGPEHRRVFDATDVLIGFYESEGRDADAAALREQRGTGGVTGLVCPPAAD
jgi:tetratricopeptide (TPR) repeat protein